MTTNLLLVALFIFCMLLMFLNHARKKKRIILFGDTITDRDLLPGGYPTWLIDQMKEEGVEDEYEVTTSIHPNDSIHQLADRLQQHVLIKDPKIVVLYAGVTDLYEGRDLNLNQVLSEFRAVYSSIVEALMQRGIIIVACTPTPHLKHRVDEEMATKNAALITLVKELSVQYNLPLLNIAALYAVGITQPDGVQVNYDKLIGAGLWQLVKDVR